MKINYSWWKSGLMMLFSGFMALLWDFLVVTSFFTDGSLGDNIILGLFSAMLGIPFTILFIHHFIAIFIRRAIFIFDDKAIIRIYGVFRHKRLVIPYDLIETIGRRDKTLSQEMNEEYGNGANRIFKNALKVAQVADRDTRLTAGSVMESTNSFFYIVFKDGDQAVAYAKQYGYRIKGKLETIRKTRIVDFRLHFAEKFSVDAIRAYIDGRKGIQ